MGVSWSCPFSIHCDLENAFEAVIVRSVEVDDDCPNSVSRFKDSGLETSMELDSPVRFRPTKSLMVSPNPKHAAATKLQKVYKSFRTRRKLADCAVLIEQSWWKLLDFAELKHSSISFFELDKHETAISRWSRARTRAAKVGKGLSKNSKAQKLALQHWLEAIDPRHRYGHNLHFYYVKWLDSQGKEPFFYWLDIGEGKEVNLIDKCPRAKLQQQCIKYLGPIEREAYEVVLEDGKLLYKQTGEFVNTTNDPKGCKWIFVLSASRALYVGKKKKGYFQHSSFLAGGATLAAGRVVAENGVLKAVWPHSGHYRPTPENFKDLLSFLQDNNVDLTGVELDSTDEEEAESIQKKGGLYLRSNSSEDDLVENGQGEALDDSNELYSNDIDQATCVHDFGTKLTALEIPSKEKLIEKLMTEENETAESRTEESYPGSPSVDGDIIPEESIFHRINSHKQLKSYQLGKHLSCKWSTGAGPRIGCLRDYPSGLQCHALEQVNLSPRSENLLRLQSPSRAPTPSSGTLRHSTLQSTPVMKALKQL